LEESLRSGGTLGGFAHEPAQETLHRPRRGEALVGELYGGFHEIRPRLAAETLMCEVKSGDGAGHADGQQPFAVGVLEDLAVLVEVHVDGCGERGLLAEVEGRDFAIRAVVDDEAAAADVSCGWQGDRQRESGSHGCIDRVTPILKDASPDLRGEVMA